MSSKATLLLWLWVFLAATAYLSLFRPLLGPILDVLTLRLS